MRLPYNLYRLCGAVDFGVKRPSFTFATARRVSACHAEAFGVGGLCVRRWTFGVCVSSNAPFKHNATVADRRYRSKDYAPLSPMASTGQPSIASLHSASSSGLSGCL